MDMALQADECANFADNIEFLFLAKQADQLNYTYTSFGIAQLQKNIVLNAGKALEYVDVRMCMCAHLYVYRHISIYIYI